MRTFHVLFSVLGIGLWLGVGVLALAQATAARAAPSVQAADPIKYGEYLADITGCKDCHTPLGADGALDFTRAFAGGQAFPLGPLGTATTANLTSDKATGIGDWTDEQLRLAIRTGLSKDGHQMFPIMPYLIYNNMADDDVNAIMAYLRTLPAIANEVPKSEINVPQDALPRVPEKTGLTAPSPTDTAARGRYLMTAILTCNDCHTPLDEKTATPIFEKYLAGGQPFAGPWGTVYAANLTPDTETGLGKWTDDDIRRIIRTGVRPDGRQVVLMPWQAYASLTEADLNGMISYLRNDLKAVVNEVPEPVLNEGFRIMVELPKAPEPSSPWPWVIGGGVVVLLAAGAVVMLRRGQTPKANG